jgi:DNA (cytosine-5)-methyltransferase 1
MVIPRTRRLNYRVGLSDLRAQSASRQAIRLGNREPRHPPSLLSVFTGAGGMDLGFEAAGFRALGCIEVDAIARATLEKNRPEWTCLEPSEVCAFAETVTPESLGLHPRELAVIAGGPPCQPFSKAAQWRDYLPGMRDHRSNGLFGLMRLVEQFLPAALLIENVPGFVRGEAAVKGWLERKLARVNDRHGTKYTPQYRILDAADYGVPQHRRRAIVVALRDGLDFEWPRPTHRQRRTTAWDAIGGIKLRTLPTCTGSWTPLLPSIPEGKNYSWHTPRGGGLPLFGFRTRYWSFLLKLSKDRPAWTISAQPGPSTGPFHWDNRPLAIIELLRLQTFPATWRLYGNTRAQVSQVGNATPPLLAEVLGRALGMQLFGMAYSPALRFTIKARQSPTDRERLGRVPDRYRCLEGEHAAHPGSGQGPRPNSRGGIRAN